MTAKRPPNPILGAGTADLIRLLVRLATLLIEAVTWWLAQQRKDRGP